MSGHAEQRAHLRTLTDTRTGRAHLADTRTVGRIRGAHWYANMRHRRTHPQTVEGCPLCDLLFELAVLLTIGDKP